MNTIKDNIAIIFFIILPLTSVLSFSKYIILLCIILMLLFCFSFKDVRHELRYLSTKKNSFGRINLMFILQYLWFGFNMVINGIGTDDIIRIIQMIGCQLAINLGRITGGQLIKLETTKKAIRAILIVSLLHWMISGHSLIAYSFIFSNPNTFGSVLLMWLVVLDIKIQNDVSIKWKLLFYGIGLFLLYCTSSRASLIALLIYLLFKYIGSKRSRINTKVLNILFYVTIIFALVFVSVYLKMTTSVFGQHITEISIRLSNKNFFSGRQRVWMNILNMVLERPVWGYGLGATPSFFFDIEASSHNLFLQIALQVGIPGLFLLLCTLKSTYNCCMHGRARNAVLGCAMVILVIIHECFEVSLTQNMLAVGLQMWFILGCGCSNADIERKST